MIKSTRPNLWTVRSNLGAGKAEGRQPGSTDNPKLILMKQVQDQARNMSQQVRVQIKSKDSIQGQPLSGQIHRGWSRSEVKPRSQSMAQARNKGETLTLKAAFRGRRDRSFLNASSRAFWGAHPRPGSRGGQTLEKGFTLRAPTRISNFHGESSKHLHVLYFGSYHGAVLDWFLMKLNCKMHFRCPYNGSQSLMDL